MTHKLIKTGNYLLVVDNSVHPYDSSKVGNPLAHLPLNGSPLLEGVDLLPPYSRHQEDDFDKKSVNFIREIGGTEQQRLAFKDGYLEACEKYKYTEEDIRQAIDMARLHGPESFLVKYREEEIIQSLHQYPTEFECEMEEYSMDMPNIHHKFYKPKTITTAKGVQWVGKYK